jgi:hypothetical protein
MASPRILFSAYSGIYPGLRSGNDAFGPAHYYRVSASDDFFLGFLSFLAVKWLFVCWFLNDFCLRFFLVFSAVFMYFSKFELFLYSKLFRFEHFFNLNIF